jgi:internalin A
LRALQQRFRRHADATALRLANGRRAPIPWGVATGKRSPETDGFVIEDLPEGRTLVVTGAWTSDALAALGRDDVDGVWLNYARGFTEVDLSFVGAWPIRRLDVLDRKLTDLAPIERLAATLEHLSVQATPGAVLNLAAFPGLRSLAAEWRAVRETVADTDGLRELIALNYDERDLWPLAENEELTKVVLKPADHLESLAGVEALSNLRDLEILAAPILDDLADLGGQPLRKLKLQDCRSVHSLDAIGTVTSLRFLGISDCGPIDSLRPLSLLDSLETFHAWGSTRIVDADLTPLTKLPRLSEIRMRARPEYEPQLSTIKAVAR